MTPTTSLKAAGGNGKITFNVGMTLAAFQGMNQTLYGRQNDVFFTTPNILSRIHRYSTRMLKMVRKNNHENFGHYLTMCFSWSLALANRLHIDLDGELWKRFPNACPYCTGSRCRCKDRATERTVTQGEASSRPADLTGYQQMLARIYADNRLEDEVIHLAEEVGELDEAIEYYTGTHKGEHLKSVFEELIDVVAHILGLASCLKIDLAQEMKRVFADGCPVCHEVPCREGYPTAQSVPVH